MATIGNAPVFPTESVLPGNLQVTGNATISGTTNSVGALTENSNAVRTVATSGAILQVAEQQYTSNFATTSSTYVDAYTGFTFTPSSATNKVYVSFIGRLYNDAASTDGGFQIVRDSTAIFSGNNLYCGAVTAGIAVISSIDYLDSPGTTSQVTYKLQGKRTSGSGQTRVLANAAAPAIFRAWEIVA